MKGFYIKNIYCNLLNQENITRVRRGIADLLLNPALITLSPLSVLRGLGGIGKQLVNKTIRIGFTLHRPFELLLMILEMLCDHFVGDRIDHCIDLFLVRERLDPFDRFVAGHLL